MSWNLLTDRLFSHTQFIMKNGKKLRQRSKYTSAMATPTPTQEPKESV